MDHKQHYIIYIISKRVAHTPIVQRPTTLYAFRDYLNILEKTKYIKVIKVLRN